MLSRTSARVYKAPALPLNRPADDFLTSGRKVFNKYHFIFSG